MSSDAVFSVWSNDLYNENVTTGTYWSQLSPANQNSISLCISNMYNAGCISYKADSFFQVLLIHLNNYGSVNNFDTYNININTIIDNSQSIESYLMAYLQRLIPMLNGEIINDISSSIICGMQNNCITNSNVYNLFINILNICSQYRSYTVGGVEYDPNNLIINPPFRVESFNFEHGGGY